MAMWLFTLLVTAPTVTAMTGDMMLGLDNALHLSFGTMFRVMNFDGSVKWSFNASSPVVTHKEGSNGTIYLITQSASGTNRTYYALSGNDGSIQWQRASLGTDKCVIGLYVELLISDSGLYLFCKGIGIQIEAVNLAGAWKWMKSFPNASEVGVGPDGGVLVQHANFTANHHALSALKSESGAVKWTTTLDKTFDGWALSKGDVFLAPYRETSMGSLLSGELDLLHLNGEDGSIFWNVSYGDAQKGIGWSHMPISGSNGDVYVYAPPSTSGFCNLLAFDFDGSKLSSWPCLSHPFKHSTWQMADGTKEDIFAMQSALPHNRTDVIAYSGSHLLWNASSIAGELAVQTVGLDGTVLTTDHVNNQMVAIRGGQEAWRVPRFFSKSLIAADGTAYLMQENALRYHQPAETTVMAVDRNGAPKWCHEIPDPTLDSALSAQASFLV